MHRSEREGKSSALSSENRGLDHDTEPLLPWERDMPTHRVRLAIAAKYIAFWTFFAALVISSERSPAKAGVGSDCNITNAPGAEFCMRHNGISMRQTK
jgi:hypothetical protein